MKKLPVWARYVIAIVGAIVFAKTIQDTVIVRMKNRQDGMYPSLPKEQAYWVYRRAYSKPADVARGDVVMMDSPTEGADYRYTWRVVGLPGRHRRRDREHLVDQRAPVAAAARRPPRWRHHLP